jgi:hypothetical protein
MDLVGLLIVYNCTEQWIARKDADQHAEKKQRGHDTDQDNADNYSRIDFFPTPSITSIASNR